MSIDKAELDELCAKLADLRLSEDQRRLLDKILKIAWDYASAQRQLDADFDGCFEPEEAVVITNYPGGGGPVMPANIINAPNG
jgi:hypothetical protein